MTSLSPHRPRITAPGPVTEEPAPAAPGRAAAARRRRETAIALAFVAPSLLGFAVFYLWPALQGVWFSLTDYAFFAEANVVGLDNYTRLVDDATFWNALWVTLQYVALNIGFQTVLAVLVAVLLHRLTQSVVIRGIVLLPFLVANVVVALTWYWMLDYQLGIVNALLPVIGVDPVAFFGDADHAVATIAFVNTWRHLGYTALLVFAGLQMIPASVYEAARTDGASEVTIFRRITLPLLRPVLALVLVITMVGAFQVFDTVAVTTGGGPAEATKVIQYYIYDLAFQQLDYGYASAVSVVLLVILAVVALVQLKLSRANESDLA